MLTIEPLQQQHLNAAAELFSAEYRRRMDSNEHLPADFADASVLREKLEAIAQTHPGMAACNDSDFMGYMIGFTGIPSFHGNPNGVYVPVWGHGVVSDEIPSDGVSGSAATKEIYTALYTALSTEWLQRKCYSHAITYFNPSSALADTLFGLGFGMLVIDGLRSLQPIPNVKKCAYTIRVATKDDIEAIAELDARLSAHLRSAPTFLNTHPVARSELLDIFVGSDKCTLLAWRDEQPIGGIHAVPNYAPGCDLLRTDGTLGVNFAYTDPEARRTGIATALLDALLEWGRDQGMVRCAVDFESANPQARGFWESHFQPICHSALRRVDERMEPAALKVKE